MKFIVRFTPPYSNSPKDIPVDFDPGATMLRDWLQSTGAKAELIQISEVENVITHV